MTSWEFPTEGPVDVKIRVPAGSVSLAASPGQNSTVRIDPSHHRDQDAIGLTRVEYHAGQLTITAPDHVRLLRGSPSLDVTVTVPPGSFCVADTASADVRCTGELGGLRAHTASGDVFAERITDEADVSTASGDVRLEQSGPAQVRTVSGDVHIAAAGGDVDSQTVSGDVRIGAVATGQISVKTTSGDITVTVAAGTGVQLDVYTLTGDASSELEYGEPGERDGAADATVICRSVSGDVSVRRAA